MTLREIIEDVNRDYAEGVVSYDDEELEPVWLTLRDDESRFTPPCHWRVDVAGWPDQTVANLKASVRSIGVQATYAEVVAEYQEVGRSLAEALDRHDRTISG